MGTSFSPPSDAVPTGGQGATNEPSTVERAFQLARSGQCHSVQEIALKLKRERYDSVEAHLAGQSIRRDLRRLCTEARAVSTPARPLAGESAAPAA
jgi:hypothetical protein